MKILVIPDIHNRVELIETTIDHVKPDLTVFLGDYFDNYGDNVGDARKTAYWLKQSVEKPNRVHLLGNHDIAYAFDTPSFKDFGWDYVKGLGVSEILSRSFWDSFRIHYTHDNWIMTHAGVFFEYWGFTTLEEAGTACEEALEAFKRGEFHYLHSDDGCLWIRHWKLPIYKGINQIFGHTPGKQVMRWNKRDRKTRTQHICLDCPGKREFGIPGNYGILENGKITVGFLC